jgi:acetyl-CoA acetyltransferase
MTASAGFDDICLLAGIEVPYVRRGRIPTSSLLAGAFHAAVARAGLHPRDVDGLGVASFTHAPDRAIDLAWKLALRPRWIMDDGNGGASGLNLLHHAARAVQCGDASIIVLLAGDHFGADDFTRLVENYNQTTRDLLRPLGGGSPNPLFAMLTAQHMDDTGLRREDYGTLVMTQRGWASQNPQAVYRSPMTLEQYLAAPIVSAPLCRFDCVPVVDGANAVVVARRDHPRARRESAVGIKAMASLHNVDHQEGSGLRTGLADIADGLWRAAGMGPTDIDVASIYDDYPVMVLVQLADLGFFPSEQVYRYVHEHIATRKLALNTSGGQLSAGQAGAACSLHGLVEAMTQLQGHAGARQVGNARHALVTGYGMVEYRYGMCSTALILEGSPR